MKTEQRRDFLINCAYWALVIAAVYVAGKYLLATCVPFIVGILLARGVVAVTRKLKCTHRTVRVIISLLIYGLIGFLVTLLVIKGVNGISGIIKWLPQVYELKLQPFVMQCYEWGKDTLQHLDPALISALESVLQSLLSSLKSLITSLSSLAVNTVSGIATGVPATFISMLVMIFSTVFVVSDYERITAFASEHTPQSVKNVLKKIRLYLTDTLFVVIRSYLLIMLLTFTELSILFSLFGIGSPVLKAGLIAIFDIMPILGTGGIMIPWAIISLVLGNAKLGISLLLIYAIVTVVRNYVEPKIVGAQLGLHPIITLVSMFVGLRVFGFLGLFGLPVTISFLWKEYGEKKTALQSKES